jgi:hypothetical protein
MSDHYLAGWGQALIWGLIIVVVGIVGAVLIVLLSRRFRSHLFPSPRRPTKYVDAWRLYRLPPGAGADTADMAPDEEPGGDDPGPSPPTA